MQITRNNTQTSFGIRNIKVGNIENLGEKTANAIIQALPEAYNIGGKNIDLLIDDYNNINPSKGGLFIKVMAMGKAHILDFTNKMELASHSSHTSKPMENKNDIIKQIESTIKGLRENSLIF